MCNWMANPSFRKGVFQSMENEIYDQKKNLPSEHWLAHEELDCCGEALQRVVVLSHHRCVVQHGSSNIGFSQYRWLGQTERSAGKFPDFLSWIRRFFTPWRAYAGFNQN